MARPPKPLQLSGGRPASGDEQPKRGTPPPLSLPGKPAAPAPAPKPPPPPLSGLRGAQKPSTPPPAPAVPRRPLAPGLDRVEAQLRQVLATDPDLEKLAHRLRPRLQRLQGAQEAALMCWGEENIEVAARHSSEQAQIAGRLAQLQVPQWVERCRAACVRPPGGLLEVFRARETPDLYEGRFRQLQAEMGPMITRISAIAEELRPELEDLRLDAAALTAVAPLYTDPTFSILVDNRHRILVRGHQATAQALAQADTTKALMIQHCQTLDQLLAVTIPNWRLAR